MQANCHVRKEMGMFYSSHVGESQNSFKIQYIFCTDGLYSELNLVSLFAVTGTGTLELSWNIMS